ncbi:MAG TPA: CHRD domain-containing protein [Anseongella sp.]|nr:CHRD domain-containing protein [Anseongella sp.]
MKKLTLYTLGATALLFAVTSCDDENDPGNGNITREWTIPLSGDLEVPSNNRSETGTARLALYTNNELRYEITVEDLASGDALTVAHVHTGDPVTSGPPVITVVDGESRTFSGNTATGSIVLTQEDVDVLMGDSIYFNVHSTQAPAGLVRRQMDQEIVFADDITLSSDNVAGGSGTIGNATATAYIRLNADNRLFYKIEDPETDNPLDQVTEGGIYMGAAGAEGEFLQDLSFEQADFGNTKSVNLNTSTVQTIQEEDTYIQLSSELAPDGFMRGQIDRD